MQDKEIAVFYPKNTQEWRDWLTANHQTSKGVWVVFHTKAAEMPSITWSESVDVALCFGWIDSRKTKIDEHTSHQYFGPRKANSTWSKINKLKIEELTAQNLMVEAGLKSVEVAKKNGSWTLLDSVEELIIPKELQRAFDQNPIAMSFYESLSKSNKKAILQSVVLAVRKETKAAKINEIIDSGNNQRKPKFI